MKSVKNYLYLLVLISVFMLFYIYLDYTSKPSNILGQFTTTLIGRSESQINNITKVLKKLDGVILNNEDTFSFNSHVGECKDGYNLAPMIVNGRVEKSLGGGICQVSSTLYNVILLSGFEIIERHAHSYETNSVPPGLDATVAFGKADLKFKNNLPFKTCIKTKLLGSRILIKVMGKNKLPYKIKISRKIKKTLVVGQTSSGEDLKNGVIVGVERNFYKKERLVKSEKISLDTYCL